MAYRGNYCNQPNYRNPEEYKKHPTSSSSQSHFRNGYSSREFQSTSYQQDSYSQGYGERSDRGGFTQRYTGNSRRGGFRGMTSQQSSYLPQAERISYQQSHQDRINQSKNNYLRSYQPNQFGRKQISNHVNVTSGSNMFAGQPRNDYEQYQDQSESRFQMENETAVIHCDKNSSGASYCGLDRFSGDPSSRNSDFCQRNFTFDSKSQETSGRYSYRGKWESHRGMGKNRFQMNKPCNRVRTEVEHYEDQELPQHPGVPEEKGVPEEDGVTEEDGVPDEDDSDEDEDNEMKGHIVRIDRSLAEKYKFHPPSAEEMGKIFKGLVIYFCWKPQKNVPEKNHFVVICTSFRTSAQFERLQVEDGYHPGKKNVKYCTLRYQDMMMVRGVGMNGNLTEPRVRAGINLINQLAMTCFTLKVKPEYFHKSAVPKLLEKKEEPGVYRVVSESEVGDRNDARKLISDMLESDSDCELVFPTSSFMPLMNWLTRDRTKRIEIRRYKEAVFICKAQPPQYWRDKILASGKMENAKFILLPPQGIGNELLQNVVIADIVPKLKKTGDRGLAIDPYGNEVRVARATVPWERKGKGRKQMKKQKKKLKRLQQQK